MDLGFFTMPLHPPGRNYVETLKEDREAIIMADRLGFTEAYVGEHTTDLAETIPSCLMFLSSLVHATSKVKLGTGTLNLPNGHPAAFAANDGSDSLDDFTGLDSGLEILVHRRGEDDGSVRSSAEDNDAFELTFERVVHGHDVVAIDSAKVGDDGVVARGGEKFLGMA